jgi:hypothetical protein
VRPFKTPSGFCWSGGPPKPTPHLADGHSHLVHDDRLLSAALVAEADRLYREGLLVLMTGQSQVIRRDLLKEVDSGG